LKSKSNEAGNQQQCTGRDQAMRESHPGNPNKRARTPREMRGVTPTIKQAVQKGWRAVRPPPDGSPNMNVRLRPVQSLVSEALKVRAVLYCLSSSGSSRHSTAIRIIDKILAAIEREN